jgi:hypothetical protein
MYRILSPIARGWAPSKPLRLSHKHNNMLSRQDLDGFDPAQGQGGHFFADLGFAHFVQWFDRHLRVLGSEFDEYDSSGWPQ